MPTEAGLFVEYLHSIGARNGSTANITSSRDIHLRVKNDYLERLSTGRIVQATIDQARSKRWQDFADDITQLKGLRNIDLSNTKTFELILTPIQWERDLTGVLMQIFTAHDRAFSIEASRAARVAASGYSSCSRWAYQYRRKKLIVDPIFASTETRIVGKQAFLIMPFGEEWSDTVEAAVRDLATELGYTTLRADDMFGQNIMEDIWKGLLTSEVIICDTTGRNPNVYYELGICHAIGKDVILITQESGDIPFDVRHLRHVVYSNTIDGFGRLKRGLKGFLG